MRKFIDGTIRIPDRSEVVDRTKVVIIQDVNSGSNDDKYCSYKTLFEGLYRANNDGSYWDNHNPFKSTGRYQTIPTVYALKDDLAIAKRGVLNGFNNTLSSEAADVDRSASIQSDDVQQLQEFILAKRKTFS